MSAGEICGYRFGGIAGVVRVVAHFRMVRIFVSEGVTGCRTALHDSKFQVRVTAHAF